VEKVTGRTDRYQGFGSVFLYYFGIGVLMDEDLSLFSQDEWDSKKFYSQDKCPICQGKSKFINQVKTFNKKSDVTVDILQCIDCLHWWINPLPEQEYLNSLYAANSPYVLYGGKTHKPTKSTNSTLKPVQQYVYNSEPSPAGLRYLEIGIGSGVLMDAFQKSGCICTGIEPGSWAREKANVYEDISQLPTDIHYDIIVATDVLEHVEKPVLLLKHLKKLGSPSSRLYCTFPNSSSFRAQYSKDKWRMVMPIGHLHFFSKDSTKQMFKEAGWKITKIKTTDLFPHKIQLKHLFTSGKPTGVGRFLFPKTWGEILIEASGFGDQWIVCATPRI
jgi:2-polyprenyl-3-methyl-5-hydroxy-6-metoxy-1,4-benzoquinol methylase